MEPGRRLSFYSNMADTKCRTLTVVAPAPGHLNAVVALEINGTCDYANYVTSKAFRSNRSDAAKVVSMLDTLAKYGDAPYRGDISQLRPVGDGLVELKPKQQRLLLFLAGVTWVITSAAPKPVGQRKVQDAWIDEGKRRKALYLTLLSQSKVTTL